ncbi:MAG: hypothetical protein J5994_05970 [Ruminococcus sp.]|nr:hypothetical protein [Ruminococcus sp.]
MSDDIFEYVSKFSDDIYEGLNKFKDKYALVDFITKHGDDGAKVAAKGAILMTNNLILLIVPVICWMYMTLFLIKTEEKWLKELYGEEYVLYCKKVNRCIPWFPKK